MKESEGVSGCGVGLAFAVPIFLAAGLIYLAWHLMLYILELLLLLLTPSTPSPPPKSKRKSKPKQDSLE